MMCSIIPPYLLRQLAALDDPDLAAVSAAARSSLLVDQPFRAVRSVREGEPSLRQSLVPGSTTRDRELEPAQRSIFDTHNTETLPGELARSDAQQASGRDVAVTEAWDGLGHTHDLFRLEYARASIDDENLPLEATVHFGKDYDNAFWDGSRMIFGDGDNTVFTRFTASLSVIGHELTHGVTQYSAALEYEGQSGALNESISDVFGALVEQRANGQSAAEASWLIGEGIFTDAVEGDAIRSMKAPGTAYDDDVLGKDPQPDHMSGFVKTKDDNGGVHLNSGMPNRAFYLVATALGGSAWEHAGKVWYDTLTNGSLAPTASFADFARATTDAAASRFGADSPEQAAVAAAWVTVGVGANP